MSPLQLRPRFRSTFRVEVVEQEGVFVVGEGTSHLLRGAPFFLVAGLVDGRRTAEEICQSLEGRLSPAEVLHALSALRRDGLVTDSDAGLEEPELAYWEALGVDPARAAARPRGAVTLRSVGGADTSALAEALREVGISLSPAPALPSPAEKSAGAQGHSAATELAIVATTDALHPDLVAIHTAHLQNGTPWLLVRPDGWEAWLGPLFVPGETGCWRCLFERQSGHQRVERYVERRTGKRLVPATGGALPSTRRAVAGLTATAVARWLIDGKCPVLGRVMTLGLGSLKAESHTLVRRPQCPDCGDAGMMTARQLAPPALEATPRTFTADGGHRRVPPEETLSRLAHHVSRVTGLIRRVVPTAAPDDTTAVYTYGTDHNFALMPADLGMLRETLRSFSGGKGRTDSQARASAIGEAIERYSGVFQGDEARVRAAPADMGGEALDLALCMGYSDRQYAERRSRNQSREIYTWVPEPFDRSRPVDMSPVWPIGGGPARYLPTAHCYYAYPFGEGPLFTQADSNGCAAGNTLSEAILQGFLELSERDAVALWWYNRLRAPGVDFDTFGEPYLPELRRHFEARGRLLWALDITSDLGIPAFVALSRRAGEAPSEGGGDGVLLGFGCHFDARIALLRAVTEHNQMLPLAGAIVGRRSGAEPPSLLEQWLTTATVRSQPYVLPSSAPLRKLTDFPRPGDGDIKDEVERCAEIVGARGMEMFVLDQTRPDTGLAVVKVIVPGLRHFWARLAPGRLYDVPVKMGHLAAPRTEDELNPIPVFI